MADNFDAVEIIYDIIKDCGVDVFKDKTPTDTLGEHVVVASPACNHGRFVNIPMVNVNIFVPRPKGGMVNRTRIKEIRTAIYNAIDASSGPDGYYCAIDRAYSGLTESSNLEKLKEGLDCFTIKYELTLNS
jgi:hypothetical protein